MAKGQFVRFENYLKSLLLSGFLYPLHHGKSIRTGGLHTPQSTGWQQSFNQLEQDPGCIVSCSVRQWLLGQCLSTNSYVNDFEIIVIGDKAAMRSKTNPCLPVACDNIVEIKSYGSPARHFVVQGSCGVFGYQLRLSRKCSFTVQGSCILPIYRLHKNHLFARRTRGSRQKQEILSKQPCGINTTLMQWVLPKRIW
jgi:hypothetical protein